MYHSDSLWKTSLAQSGFVSIEWRVRSVWHRAIFWSTLLKESMTFVTKKKKSKMNRAFGLYL